MSSPAISEGIPNDLRAVMRRNYDDLIDFVVSPNFKAIIQELYHLPAAEQPGFVLSVLLDPAKLAERGITIPEGVLIQRSSFGDGRPTLFVVKKYLPDGYRQVWENVNITFDVNHQASEVLHGAGAWKKPLPWDVRAALQAIGLTQDDLARMGS